MFQAQGIVSVKGLRVDSSWTQCSLGGAWTQCSLGGGEAGESLKS